MRKTEPQPFQLLADHPVLDFINTLDYRFAPTGALEKLSSYADLLRFSEQAALLHPRQLKALSRRRNSAQAAHALEQAHALRESLAAAFYDRLNAAKQPSPRGLGIVERLFVAAAEHQKLSWEPAPPPARSVALRAAWHWGSHSASLMLPVWILAQSAVSLLTSPRLELVHQCQSETCRWLFLDSSKNHSRRWCDMKLCGNRMKARRFRAHNPA